MTTENKQPDERAALDDAIARAKRILEAVDTYHARPDGGNRHALRSMLLDEFQELLGARATTQQANKGDEAAFEAWYERENRNARERLDGDDWRELNPDEKDNYAAAFKAGVSRAAAPQAAMGDEQAAFNEWKKDWWFADGGVSENEICSYADAEAAAESAFNAGASLARGAAPQAVTLSDEDIKRIALEYCAEDGAIPSYEWIRFSRALLAAHPEQRMSDGSSDET